MILIDAIYVNNGGGKVLLDYLISELEKTELIIYYLIDNRILRKEYKIKDTNFIEFIDSSLSCRNGFYNKNKNKFSKVFCLGNIPPNIRLEAKVFTYFHNTILIEVPKEFSLIEKIKYKLKVFILKSRRKNTDVWLVQTQYVLNRFLNKFEENDKIKVLSFYPPLNNFQCIDFEKVKDTFLYVSNAQDNKNHLRLIQGFCNFFDKYQKGKLILTVNKDFENIIKVIDKKIGEKYPIVNLGFVNRKILSENYEKSEYVIFPSLSESFGLGLIEGIEFDCKIIGADLPYTFAVCEPSMVFNPQLIESIEKAFEVCTTNEIKKSILKAKNDIMELISELS